MVAIPRYEEKYAPNMSGGASKASGADPLGEALGQVGTALGQIGAQMYKQKKAQEEQLDALKLGEAQNLAKEAALDLRYNSETGYLNQTGPNALIRENGLSLSDDYTLAYKNRLGEIENTLTNPRQREAFKLWADGYSIDYQDKLLQHQNSQYQLHEKTINLREIENAHAIIEKEYEKNPQEVAAQTQFIGAKTKQNALKQGYSPEIAEKMRWDAQSQGHITAINAAIQNKNPAYAQQYIATHKNNINPEELAKKTAELQDLQSTQLGEEIAAPYIESFNQRVGYTANNQELLTLQEKLKQNPLLQNNPKALTSAEYQLNFAWAQKNRENKEQQNNILGELKTMTDQQTGNLYSLSPQLRNSLTEENKQMYINYERYKINGKPVKQSDRGVVHQLSNDDHLISLSDNEFAMREASLHKTDYEYFAYKRQDLLAGGDGTGDPKDPRSVNSARMNNILNSKFQELPAVRAANSASRSLEDLNMRIDMQYAVLRYVLAAQKKAGRQLNERETEYVIDQWFFDEFQKYSFK